MQIGSKELIRDINTTLVLEAIIEKAPLSRAALSKELGLTKATISSIVQDLIHRGLVYELGSAKTTIGRKPTMLSFQQSAGNTLCIDLGIQEIRYMITDLLGKQQFQETIILEDGYENQVIPLLKQLIERSILRLRPSIYGIVGITIAIHGVTHQNRILFTPYYDMQIPNLAEVLESAYDIPVHLYNDSNLAVMGENAYSTRVSNIASIYVYSGIGLGMILNGHLYEGANGYAGEFGHTIIELDGRQCPCGNRGCLEQYASQRALLKELAQRKGRERLSFEQFSHLYRNQDADATYIVDRFVKIMAAGINNLLNLYNPEVILLNSRFTAEFPTILDQIKERLQPRMELANSLRLSKMNDDAILYGAAYVNSMHFLKLQHFRPQLRF